MSEAEPQTNLLDLLNENTTPEQFDVFVSQILTKEDIKLFGANATKLVGQALVYPAVFAPYPATFDSEAFAAVIDDLVDELGLESIDPDRIDRLLTIARENGIVDVNEKGRLFILPEVQKKLQVLFT